MRNIGLPSEEHELIAMAQAARPFKREKEVFAWWFQMVFNGINQRKTEKH